MKRIVYPGTWQAEWAFSPMVAAEGGRMVWVAGHTGQADETGKSNAGDIVAQSRQTFRNIAKTLAVAGATLDDIVTMTVFISDARHSKAFTDVRGEFFKKGNYPASALITVEGFAQPEMMVEVQCVAVVAE